MAEYRPNHAGIQAMLATPAMVEALRVKAGKVRDLAEATAPVRTGQYAHGTIEPGGFHVTAGVRDRKAFARVTNTAPHARFVEWAHREHDSDRIIPGQHILAHALDALRTT